MSVDIGMPFIVSQHSLYLRLSF